MLTAKPYLEKTFALNISLSQYYYKSTLWNHVIVRCYPHAQTNVPQIYHVPNLKLSQLLPQNMQALFVVSNPSSHINNMQVNYQNHNQHCNVLILGMFYA